MLILIIIFVFFPVLVKSSPYINPIDYNVLKDMYTHNGGDKWKWNTDPSAGTQWNFSTSDDNPNPDPCNHWQGVYCIFSGFNGSIFSLQLPGYGLKNHVSDSICDLIDILIIDLSNNFINGSLPNCISTKLNGMISFNMSINQLTGTMPLISSPYLEYLSLSNNNIKGPINLNIEGLISLKYLYLMNNYFTGTLSSDIYKLANLSYIQISNNHLSSTIPWNSINKLKNLNYIAIGANNFKGKIEIESKNMDNLYHLSLYNNSFTSTISSEITNLKSIQYLDLASNKLTGSIPSMMNLTKIEVLLVQNNNFIGDLLNLFDSNSHLYLQHLDISDNGFTNSLPSEFFKLPGILTVSAAKNCFTGELPVHLCNSTSLQALILDGLSSGNGCKHGLFDPLNWKLTKGYFASALDGEIPSCIWAIPNITTLHLSGNSLQGYLDDVVIISPLLTNVSLSYNRISGELSDSLKSFWSQFILLDLSRNRITGNIESMGNKNKNKDTNINLIVNRLSGYVSDEINKAGGKVSILYGNTFGCSKEYPLPSKDPYSDTYFCGSDTYNESFILFGGAIFFILLFSFILYFFWSPTELIYEISSFLKINKSLEELPNIKEFIRFMTFFRLFCTKISLFSVFILLPVYLIMYSLNDGNDFSTQEFIYGWSTTIAFLCGNIVAGILFFLFICVSWYIMEIVTIYSPLGKNRKIKKYKSSLNELRNSILKSNKKEVKINENLMESLLDKNDLGFILEKDDLKHVKNKEIDDGSIKILQKFEKQSFPVVGHVDISSPQNNLNRQKSNESSSLKSNETSSSEIRDSIISYTELNLNKCTCNVFIKYVGLFIINSIISLSVNIVYVYVLELKMSRFEKFLLQLAMSSYKLFWTIICRIVVGYLPDYKYKTSFHVLILLWNSLFVPCLATAVTSKQCFQELIYGTDEITSSYSFEYCQQPYQTYNEHQELITTCPTLYPAVFYTTFIPPFIYTYQCGSAILINYIPVFIYLYTFLGLILPIIYIFLAYIPTKFLPNFILSRLHGLLRPQDHYSKFNHFIFANTITSQMVQHLIVLLTFGLACPPLSVILCFSMISSTYMWQFIILRYISYDCIEKERIDRFSSDSDSSSNESRVSFILSRISYIEDNNTNVKNKGFNFDFEKINTLKLIDKEFKGSTTVALRSALSVILASSVLFYSFVLYDIAGDQSGYIIALWVPSVGIAILIAMVIRYSYLKNIIK